jgi:hypothetical protein
VKLKRYILIIKKKDAGKLNLPIYAGEVHGQNMLKTTGLQKVQDESPAR